MSALNRLRSFARALLFRHRLERDMEREWQFHVDARVDDLVARGLSRAEAEQRARNEFGDRLRWKEQGREVRGLRVVDELRQDIAYAVRQLSRAPGFTLVALLTLALGIGANTAIFSVVNAVLLRPLPYPDSDRLVRIVHTVRAQEGVGGPQRRTVGMMVSDMATFRAQATTLSHVGTYGGVTVLLTGRDESTRLDAVRVSVSVFDMVKARALVGRVFEPHEETAGADAVVVLSHAAWQRLFGGASSVLDESLILNGRSYAVIGVMPPEFQFPDAQTQLWIPYALTGPEARARVPPIARLADGVSIQAATAEVGAILRDLPTTAQPTAAGPPQFELSSIYDDVVEPVRPALLVLLGAVAVVLLIACVNVANLLLARTAARQRELAIRLALGAGRARLMRQLLTENLLLALVGAATGVSLAFGGLYLLRRLGQSLARRDMFADVSIPRLDEVTIDLPVLGFTLALAIVAGVVSGIGPAIRQTATSRADVLREGAASMISGFNLVRRHRLQGVLVIAEIGMAILLLVGGGLLMRSFANLSNVDPGYDPTNVVTFQVFSPRIRSLVGINPPTGADAHRPWAFAEALVPRLQSLPGARVVGYAELLPMVRARSGVRLRPMPGMPAQPPPPPSPGAGRPPESPDVRTVSRDFLRAMGMRVIEGRTFGDHDGAGRPQVMLINRTLARSGFRGAHPVGATVYAMGPQPWEVVGVVDDVRQYSLDQAPDPQIFIDIRQLPTGNANVYYAVRADGDLTALVPSIRAIVQQLDGEAMIDNVATMEQLVSNSVSRPRLYAVLLGIFAAVAVTLAAIGIYGVMAYAVGQRTREIGIRMALGAERSTVTRLVLGQSLVLIGIGTVVGLAGAAAVTRYLEGMLFGLTPLDASTFITVSVVFVAIATLAAFVPARRATKVDPLVALRCE